FVYRDTVSGNYDTITVLSARIDTIKVYSPDVQDLVLWITEELHMEWWHSYEGGYIIRYNSTTCVPHENRRCFNIYRRDPRITGSAFIGFPFVVGQVFYLSVQTIGGESLVHAYMEAMEVGGTNYQQVYHIKQ